MNFFILALDFIKGIWIKRFLIIEMAKRDFKKQYASSYLGIAWAFLHPLVIFSVMYLIFSMGFRGGGKVNGVPFIAYFFSGMITYSFFSSTVASGINALLEYSFLVRKVDFRLSILPIVKIISGFWLHLFFLCILFVVVLLTGMKPSLYWFQVIYYMICSMIFVIGLSWVLSSIQPFVSDVGRAVSVLLQLGFWITPVFWNINIIPEKYQYLLKLNPAFYIVNGYRDSLLYNIGFWEHPTFTIYFWSVTVFSLFSGMFVYRRLRPHFAEVM